VLQACHAVLSPGTHSTVLETVARAGDGLDDVLWKDGDGWATETPTLVCHAPSSAPPSPGRWRFAMGCSVEVCNGLFGAARH